MVQSFFLFASVPHEVVERLQYASTLNPKPYKP